MKTDAIPEGYRTITPYLSIHGVPEVLEFLKKAFRAEVVAKHALPDGTVVNAEVRIGDSMLMLGERPKDQKAWPCMLYLYVENADDVYGSAIQAGGKSVLEPTDQVYGDRSGAVEDSAGNQWWIATRKENIPQEELIERMARKRKP